MSHHLSYRRIMVANVIRLCDRDTGGNMALVNVREAEELTVLEFAMMRPYHDLNKGEVRRVQKVIVTVETPHMENQ